MSCIGFETIDVIFKGGVLNISLKEDKKLLDEVVVVGYGVKQIRSKITNSISSVKEGTLEKGIFSNPAQALSGAVAGLKVSQTSGNPGATPSVVLRGGTNFNGTGSPLILVDGQVRGSMSDINPDDIESMEVLKDAGATAIYGARANDGVILITTKRGKEGSTQLNFKAKVGWNFFRSNYDFLGAEDYLYWVRMAYKNANMAGLKHPDGTPVKDWASMAGLKTAQPFGTGNAYFAADGKTPLDGNVSPNAIYSPMIYNDNLAFLLNEGWKTMEDPVYKDKIIYKEFQMKDFNITSPALSQDYNISAQGGNNKGHYYAGLGFNHSQGNAYGNFYKRLTFILNADYKIKPWLTSTSSFNFADASWNGLPPTQGNESNYFSRVFSVPPTFRGYNANKEMLLGPSSSDGNQRFNFDKFIRDNNTDKFTINQSFTFDIFKDLSLKIGGILFISEGNYESFNKDFLNKPNNWNRARNTSASWNRTTDQTYNAVLNYKNQINQDHFVDAMLGFEYYDSYTKGFSASGSGAPTDDFQDLGLTSSEENKRSIDSYHQRQRIMSFFGRLNYDFRSKYLLSFVIRQDGYSRLSQQNRWGVFPGVSAGWIFSKEGFFAPLNKYMSFGKLRASFGLNGNVNPSYVGYYTVQGAYSTTKYNNNIGYLLSSIPNPYLKWEKSRTFELGLDISFIENTINANLTYYNRLTSDKFASITIPAHSGTGSVTSNNGKFRNQGFEFELAFKVLNKKDWKWNIAWNGAYNINKVIQLPNNNLPRNRQGAFEVYTGNQDEKMWVGGLQEGMTPGDIYLFMPEGIYRSQDEIPAGLIDITSGNNGSNGRPLYGGEEGYNKLTDEQKKNALPIMPGDVKWKDINNDGKIDNFDLVKVGNSTPKWTGGINSTISWKGLSLSVRMDYGLGFTIVDYRTPWLMGMDQGTYNTITDTKQTFSATNTNAKYPTYTWADQLGKRNYNRATAMFAYNGNYLSFREMSLVYNLPKFIVKKINLSGIAFSVTGQNLGYLTKAKHIYSPETSYNNGGYPLPRTIIFGANITF